MPIDLSNTKASDTHTRPRGPRPGSHHPGMFKSGFDSRRSMLGTRKRTSQSLFKELIEERAEGALLVMDEVMQSPDSSDKDKLAAAELILAYHAGRPVDRSVALSLSDGDGGQIDALTLVQRQMLIGQRREESDDRADQIDGIIEGEIVGED